MAIQEAVINHSCVNDVKETIIKPYREKGKQCNTYPGPIELCITECQVLDECKKPARVLKHGECFYLCMDVYYSELLGDLNADYVAEFHVMNLATCDIVEPYCCSIEGELECDTTRARIYCKFECTEKGIFNYTASIYLPHSDLFDFCCFEECFACQPVACHDNPKEVRRNAPMNSSEILRARIRKS